MRGVVRGVQERRTERRDFWGQIVCRSKEGDERGRSGEGSVPAAHIGLVVSRNSKLTTHPFSGTTTGSDMPTYAPGSGTGMPNESRIRGTTSEESGSS